MATLRVRLVVVKIFTTFFLTLEKPNFLRYGDSVLIGRKKFTLPKVKFHFTTTGTIPSDLSLVVHSLFRKYWIFPSSPCKFHSKGLK